MSVAKVMILMLVIVVANIWALFLYLRWRNSSNQPAENGTFVRISCLEGFFQLFSSTVGVSIISNICMQHTEC